MSPQDIKRYKAKGWRFKRSRQPDPQSGESNVCDWMKSPRIQFWGDLNDTEQEMLESECHSYIQSVTEKIWLDGLVEAGLRKKLRQISITIKLKHLK